MLDPLLTLSFNVHAQHGTYALLLGSGVSRSAAIPTGWEVTLDLISKLARLGDEDPKGDEAGWYRTKFGKEPNYSELLSAVAPTSAAQQQLLRRYFEPSQEEREQGRKLPTAAHRAIARLVRLGYLRVIVTTNFDRLLEAALEAEGIAHPLSTQAAISSLKRYLSEDKFRIQLRDFLLDESQRTRERLVEIFSKFSNSIPNEETVSPMMGRIEAACEIISHEFATGSFYARGDQGRSFFDAFQVIVSLGQSTSGYTVWSEMRKYASLILCYVVGPIAIASENYTLLREMILRPSLPDDTNGPLPAPAAIIPQKVLGEAVKYLPQLRNRYTPASDYILPITRESAKSVIPDDDQYLRAFDDFECLWSLLRVDTLLQAGKDYVWTPIGAFIWRRRADEHSLIHHAIRAAESSDATWWPLQVGFFGGSVARLSSAVETAKPTWAKASSQMY